MHDAQIRVAIAGAGGRMGRQLIQAALQMDGVALGAALEREGSSLLGSDAGELAGQDVGKLVYDLAVYGMAAEPQVYRANGQRFFTPEYFALLQGWAQRSQQRMPCAMGKRGMVIAEGPSGCLA